MEESTNQMAGGEASAPETILKLKEYTQILKKRFWAVLLCVAIGLGGAFLITKQMPRKYRASASIELSLQAPRILGQNVQPIDFQTSDWWSGRTFLKTQYKILKSRNVALKAAKRLRNEDLWLLLGLKDEQKRPPTEEDYQKAAAVIQGGLEVEPVKESRIVLVRFVNTSPKLAATVPNMVALTDIVETPPRICYMYDWFKKPVPFQADVVVAIDEVIERKFRMLACHESQFFEWLPFNKGVLDEVPEEPEARLQWLQEQRLPEYERVADTFRDRLVELYGEERGRAVRYAEAFEACEYGAGLTAEELRKLFPFF